MNPKRLIIAIIALFVAVFATDFVIHGLWMDSAYKKTADLWRTEAGMQQKFGWLMLGQFLAAVTFVVLYAKGFAATACARCAVMYGLFMGLFNQSTTLITYAVQPFPGSIAAQWFVAGALQGVLLGLLVFFVYKPKLEAAKS